MKIISSQSFIDWEVVESKMEELTNAGSTSVIIPCWAAGEIDGEEFAVQSDKHHTLCAARELGLDIQFEIVDHPEGLTGTDLLEAAYMDCDWYDVENSDLTTEQFNYIW